VVWTVEAVVVAQPHRLVRIGIGQVTWSCSVCIRVGYAERRTVICS
jgi:hypothetical protein